MQDSSQDFTSEATPGQFDIIPDGYELTEWDPNYPNDVYDPFTKAIARSLATGCLVSYHGLTGDLTQVNFSSIRSGTLDEREMWKMVQGWYIQAAKEPVFEWWLARALINDADLKLLPYSKFDKFNSPSVFRATLGLGRPAQRCPGRERVGRAWYEIAGADHSRARP